MSVAGSGGIGQEAPQAGRRGLFILVGLAPMLLLYAALLFGAMLSLLISLGSSASQGGGGLGLAALAFGLVLAPVLVALALNRMLRGAHSWRRRGVLLYLSLDVLALGLLFAFLVSLGGASMAVVEWAAGGRELAAGVTFETALCLLGAQLLIVPWTAVVTYFASRLTS